MAKGGKEQPLEERERACRLFDGFLPRAFADWTLDQLSLARQQRLWQGESQATIRLDGERTHISAFGLEHLVRWDGLARIFADLARSCKPTAA